MYSLVHILFSLFYVLTLTTLRHPKAEICLLMFSYEQRNIYIYTFVRISHTPTVFYDAVRMCVAYTVYIDMTHHALIS